MTSVKKNIDGITARIAFVSAQIRHYLENSKDYLPKDKIDMLISIVEAQMKIINDFNEMAMKIIQIIE